MLVVVAALSCGPGGGGVGTKRLALQAIDEVVIEAGHELTVKIIVLRPAASSGAPVTLRAFNLPAFATMTGDTITFAPGRTESGDTLVTVLATDGVDTATMDFTVRVVRTNTAPDTACVLLDENAWYLLGQGPNGSTVHGPPQVQCFTRDADGDDAQVLVEVVPSTAAFSGVPTHQGPLAPLPAELTVIITGLDAGVEMKVAVWGRDARGVENSAYVFPTPVLYVP